MNEVRIIGLMIYDRVKEAGITQKILTRYAHIIKSRLGFHEVNENICSRVGMIILQLTGNPEQWDELEKELREIGGVKIEKMSFEY